MNQEFVRLEIDCWLGLTIKVATQCMLIGYLSNQNYIPRVLGNSANGIIRNKVNVKGL